MTDKISQRPVPPLDPTSGAALGVRPPSDRPAHSSTRGAGPGGDPDAIDRLDTDFDA